jgi:DNA replication protein DnaC
MEQLTYQLKSIRLSGMAAALPVRIQEARASDMPHLDFLSILVNDELEKRKDRLLKKRLKEARFSELKTIDDFDFLFNPGISKKTILDLASCRFVTKAENILILGPPGVGKTHLAISIGIGGIHAGYTVLYRSVFDLVEDLAEAQALNNRRTLVADLCKPNILIIDEFGMRALPANAAEDLLEIFHRRYHKGSTIIATNRPLEDWGKILGDHASASAILDRFMDNVHLIKIIGRSYRLKSVNHKTTAVDKKEIDKERKNR